MSSSLLEEQVNEAIKMYNTDDMEECEEACEDLLDTCVLPRYLRIRTLILAALATANYWKAENWRKTAEALYSFGRLLFPTEDKTAPKLPDFMPQPQYATAEQEAGFAELRGLLDGLKSVQDEEKKWLHVHPDDLDEPATDREDEARTTDVAQHMEQKPAAADISTSRPGSGMGMQDIAAADPPFVEEI